MKRLSAFLILTVFFVSCKKFSENVTNSIDARGFRVFGGTFFSSVEEVSINQLLLDTANLANRTVIVEGDILSIGDYFTYLIVNDESAKLLVVLTGMEDYVLKIRQNQRVKILGQVESGKKGFPFIKAQSIREI